MSESNDSRISVLAHLTTFACLESINLLTHGHSTQDLSRLKGRENLIKKKGSDRLASAGHQIESELKLAIKK